MAERIQTDTDADPQSAIGVGQVDQTLRALHEIQPNWLADGYGIRGPQQTRDRRESVSPTPMEFGLPSGDRGVSADFGNGPCAPTAPPESGTSVWGSVDGTCQWIDTTDCTPAP
jgi:hypothetical protein